MKIRATQAIMECLLEQGVDTVFGYPGGTILNVYDELYRYQDRIRHILTAHEQGAAHAADGYARSTGKVGVCFATSGPGATNLTTGIATAYLDSSPVVFITCNVGENLLGKDAFQEVDITGIAMPITKATFLVRDARQIPDVMRQAFAVAATGNVNHARLIRRGIVHLFRCAASIIPGAAVIKGFRRSRWLGCFCGYWGLGRYGCFRRSWRGFFRRFRGGRGARCRGGRWYSGRCLGLDFGRFRGFSGGNVGCRCPGGLALASKKNKYHRPDQYNERADTRTDFLAPCHFVSFPEVVRQSEGPEQQDNHQHHAAGKTAGIFPSVLGAGRCRRLFSACA